ARGLVATELLRRQETARVIEALAAHDIVPVLLKGTPLAYTVYEEPSLRPRSDTDLLIRREDTDTARRAMAELGHTATNFSDGELLFRQFELRRTDAYGVLHAFDFHWRLSTEALFADLLSYDELLREAIPVPRLGDGARAA